MTNFNFLLNLLGKGPKETSTQGGQRLGSIVSRLCVVSLICACMLTLGVGNAWGVDVTWNINGVNTTASYQQVNTTLKISSVSPNTETGVWTAVSNGDNSYAGSNSGAQLGASSGRQFEGTITLSNTSIPSTATITAIKVTGKANGNYTISATVGGSSFGSSISFNSTTASQKTISGSKVGNTIVLSVSPTTNKYLNISKIIVSYTAAAATPTLTVSKTSISSGLTYVQGSGPSAAQTFTVSGSNLTANVTVNAPTNFEVSKDGSSYAASQTITASGTLSTTTIYVRLKSGLTVNSYSGNITVESTGATSKTVSLSGSVTAPSYTVAWTINPAAGGSLSATSGTSTTVTLNSAYTYGSPAYTVTTGSATVVQSTNTFTATPTANCTIRINTVEKAKYSVTWYVEGVALTGLATGLTSVYTGERVTALPDAPSSSCSGEFVGWAQTGSGVIGQKPGDSYTSVPTTFNTQAGSPTITENTSFYAVFRKQKE